MRRIVIITLLVVLPMLVIGQIQKVQNRPYIDFRQLHYGFFVGMHMQDLELANNGYVTENGEQWFADVASYSPGFSVGVLAELRLNTYFALRLVPTMHFGERVITFRENGSGEMQKQQMKSTYIAMPLNVKIAAERFNNYRPFIIAGINPMLSLTNKKQQHLLMKSFDFMVEIGLGCDFYLPFFKLIPELKFGFSLLDILQKNRTDLLNVNMQKFVKSIDKASSKMIVFSLFFE